MLSGKWFVDKGDERTVKVKIREYAATVASDDEVESKRGDETDERSRS